MAAERCCAAPEYCLMARHRPQVMCVARLTLDVLLINTSARAVCPHRVRARHVPTQVRPRTHMPSADHGRHRPFAPPLTCLSEDFWRHTREIRPFSTACRHAADTGAGRAHQEAPVDHRDQVQLWDMLQTPSCKGSRLVSTQLPAFGGWLSVLHSIVKPAMHAVNSGKLLLTPSAMSWTDGATCSSRSTACFFLPLSPCDNVTSVQRRAVRSTAEAVVVTAGSFVQELSERQQGDRGLVHHRGWFWLVASLQRYIMRPSPALHRRLQEARVSTGLDAVLARGEPVLGLHVRHGDSCSRNEANRTRRQCDPLADYMAAVERLASGLNVSTIYLATDSQEVLEETKAYPQYTFLYFAEARSFNQASNPSNRKWDDIVRRNKLNASLSTNERLAWLTTLDVMMLSRCSLFVGKHTSNFFRTAYELAAAECECAPPFVSLDAPWCFDWGLATGINKRLPEEQNSFTC